MPPFRFVLIGAGNIAGTYRAALARLADTAVIVAIVARQPERAAAFAADCGDVPVWPDLGAVAVPYDAVILATPNGTHHALAIDAASRGKHVLTEKTLDISPARMDRMIAACTAAGVTLAVTYQRRCSPDNQALKRLLDAGALGRVHAIDLAVKFFRPQSYYDSAAYRGSRAIDGGGPFMQQASHNLDILCWFLGLPVDVRSLLSRRAHERIDVEDHGAAILRWADGAIGSVVCSTACKPGFAARLEIHAERGSVVLVNDRIVDWQVEGLANPAHVADFTVHSGSTSAAVVDTAGHEAILRDFVEAVRHGRTPIAAAASARLATDLIDRIYRESGFYPPDKL